jgi:hypothetical protein
MAASSPKTRFIDALIFRLTGIQQQKGRVTSEGRSGVFPARPAVVVVVLLILTSKTFPAKAAFVMANPKSKLLDQIREVLRVKYCRLRTEGACGQ